MRGLQCTARWFSGPKVATKRLVSPDGKPRVLHPVRPNAGIEAQYRRKLEALLAELHGSVTYWLTAAYRRNTPEMAADASPAAELRAAMRKLVRRWTRRVDQAAPELARWFAETAAGRSDAALQTILKRAGFAVEFRLTRAANDVLSATMGQNVSLIRSIASQHLAQVETLVMQSVQTGRDLAHVAGELEGRYGVTKRRAAFIAQHQNNLATAAITRVRHAELGITHCRWVHSAGGRLPRASHVKAGRDGLTYEAAKGAFIDGELVWPGQLPGCRCVARPVIAGFD